MKATLRTIYALIVLSVMFILATTPFSEVEAATAGPAIAAGGRAMHGLDPEHRAWLRTLHPQDQRAVLCAQLLRDRDTEGGLALECAAAEDYLTWQKVADLHESWDRYHALFGYVTPTDNDMARIPAAERADVRKGIACRRIRDKIEAQVFLMKSGSTGYWNIDTLRNTEMGWCGSNMDLTAL